MNLIQGKIVYKGDIYIPSIQCNLYFSSGFYTYLYHFKKSLIYILISISSTTQNCI